mmetsp:Transcript_6616/g.19081  ORF Transcript_6616/g.19081 Transcript_6616/m.19081 type:complete len:107 (-) Transcript_6616:89-409(-)
MCSSPSSCTAICCSSSKWHLYTSCLVKQLPQEVLSDLLTAREAEVRRRNAKLLQTVEMLALQLRRERERHRRLVAKVAVQRQSVSDARNTVAAMQSLISANSSLSH